MTQATASSATAALNAARTRLGVPEHAPARVRRAPTRVVRGKKLPHMLRWFSSLPDFANLLEADEPWVTFGAIDWFERIIRPDMRVAEFGSGASTLYWTKRVREVVAVEHHRGWHERLTAELAERNINNCRYVLAEPKPLAGTEDTLDRSQKNKYEDLSFADYTRAIESEADASFDIVFVDGRARVGCMMRSLPKIKPGGYLVLDNAERERYQGVREELAHHRRIDFRGIGPRQVGRWTTSVWQIAG